MRYLLRADKGPSVRLFPSNLNGTNRDLVWNIIISKLIDGASLGDPLQRGSAIMRLYHLYKWKCLSGEEIKAFAEALWSVGSRDDFGLPVHTGLVPRALLAMPETESGQAKAALLAYLSQQSGKSDENLYSRVHAAGDVLRGLIQSGHDVVLSDDQSTALRSLTLSWIEQRARPASAANQILGSHNSHEGLAVESIAAIICHVSLEEATLEQLVHKVDRMDDGQDGRYSAAPLYPFLTQIRPNLGSKFLERLRRGLLSDDEDTARQAVVGVSRWLQAYQSNPSWERVDLNDVVREIGIAIASRRLAILPNALDFAAWLFGLGPLNYRELIAADCEFGLAALRSEAKYDRTPALPDVPQIRALAMALATKMSDAGFGHCTAVRGWLEDAENDPLPEVRNARPTRGPDDDEGGG